MYGTPTEFSGGGGRAGCPRVAKPPWGKTRRNNSNPVRVAYRVWNSYRVLRGGGRAGCPRVASRPWGKTRRNKSNSVRVAYRVWNSYRVPRGDGRAGCPRVASRPWAVIWNRVAVLPERPNSNPWAPVHRTTSLRWRPSPARVEWPNASALPLSPSFAEAGREARLKPALFLREYSLSPTG